MKINSMSKFKLNPNNYLYKVENFKDLTCNENVYILFNKNKCWWISLDEVSVEIYREFEYSDSLHTIQRNLIAKFEINELLFNNDILPFLELLINKGFLILSSEEKELANKNIQISRANYPIHTMYISLTNTCNLNCIYCFNKSKRQTKRKIINNTELSIDEYKQAMLSFVKLGGTEVVFTGGEPTLNNKLFPLCKIAKKMKLKTHFITNGTNFKSINLTELFAYVDDFAISLDSLDQLVLEKLWNNKHIRAKNILNSLVEVNTFSKDNNHCFKIIISPIVSKINIATLPNLVSCINEILCDCSIRWNFTTYDPINDPIVDNEMIISKNEYFNAVFNSFAVTYSINNCEKEKNNLIRYAISECGKKSIQNPSRKIACNPSFFILDNGDVFPCQGLESGNFNFGNIREKSLKEMLDSSIFESMIEKISISNLEQCKDCELNKICSNICPGSETRFLTKVCKMQMIQLMYLQTKINQD